MLKLRSKWRYEVWLGRSVASDSRVIGNRLGCFFGERCATNAAKCKTPDSSALHRVWRMEDQLRHGELWNLHRNTIRSSDRTNVPMQQATSSSSAVVSSGGEHTKRFC